MPRVEYFLGGVTLLLLLVSCCTCNNGTALVKPFERIPRNTSELFCRPPENTELESSKARSVVECNARCLRSNVCNSTAFSDVTGECLLYDVFWKQEQCVEDSGWQTWNKEPCKNRGYMKDDGDCQCVGGYLGDRCERLMEDCMEAKLSGHYPELGKSPSRYLLARPRLSPRDIPVACRKKGHTIFLQKSDNNTAGSFNRSWSQYVNGFWAAEDLWVGLENLYYFTNSKSYKLGVFFTLHNFTRTFVTYDSFRVEDTVTFTLTLGSYKTDTRPECDLLSNIHGQSFSTYDSDNDDDGSRNCAAEYGGGWWFNGCPDYNFMGRVGLPGEEASAPTYLFYGTAAPPGTVRFLALSLV